MTRDFALALGLVFVIEGLLYAFVPGQLRRMALVLETLSNEQVRFGGACAVALGVGLVWLVQSFWI